MRPIVLSISLALGTLAVAGSPPLMAEPAAQASSVVDTAFVQEAIKRGAVLWDVRGEADFAKGHLPGAVNVGQIGDTLRYAHNEDYLPVQGLEKTLGAAGIDPAKEIVVYGPKANPYVYFGALTLKYFGADKVSVYHGGVEDWQAAGQKLETGAPQVAAAQVKLAASQADLLVGTEEVIQKVGDPAVQFIDARTPAEYAGEDIRALRGGHIPGAVSIPYEQNWVDPDAAKKLKEKKTEDKSGLNLKSPEQLKALYAGLDPDKETIVYCQSGIRASDTALLLKDLGFSKVKVYDSSWLGYANTLSAKVESETFFNVGAMLNKVSALEKRLADLEQQMKAPPK